MALAIDSASQTNPSPRADGSAAFTAAVADLRALHQSALERVDGEILDCLRSQVEMIPQVGGHLVGAGGKRLRPLMTIATADLFGYEGRNHVRLAAAVELIHGATLLHDDVVDQSSMRRGARTANLIWGNKESVLVGDFIFSRSFELMVATGNMEVLRILSRAAGVIAEGEVLQLGTQKNIQSTFEMYLAVVQAKTAALFAAAAQSGAVIAGATPEQAEAARLYGENLGIAYQLVDDALDYSGLQAALGKDVGDDFREGKMTLPIVYALQRANDEEEAFWRRTIAEGRQEPGDLERAIELVKSNGALADTIECAHQYADQAAACLKILPDGASTPILAEIARLSTEREY